MRGEAQGVGFVGVVLIADRGVNRVHILHNFTGDGVRVDAARIVHGLIIAVPELFIGFPAPPAVDGCRVRTGAHAVHGVCDFLDCLGGHVVVRPGLNGLDRQRDFPGIVDAAGGQDCILQSGHGADQEAHGDRSTGGAGELDVAGRLLRGKQGQADGFPQVVEAGPYRRINETAIVDIFHEAEQDVQHPCENP